VGAAPIKRVSIISALTVLAAKKNGAIKHKAHLSLTSGTLVWYPPFSGSPSPCRPLLARAAAANVNPRTRLSHPTPLSSVIGAPTEQCRLMMQKLQNSRQMIPRTCGELEILPVFSQDFPRKSDGAQGSSTLSPTHTAEAWCMMH
jgi:hypothetical protein